MNFPRSDKTRTAGSGRRGWCAHRRIGASARSLQSIGVAAAAACAVLAGGPASLAAAKSEGGAAAVHLPGRFSAADARGARATENSPSGHIIGSPRTKALLAKVHRAYLHVPAVEFSVIARKSTLRFPRRFVLILRSGVVVAEEFTRPGTHGVTLVAHRFHHTYSRVAGATCWRRLPTSNPQTLADVGIPFPYTRVNIKVLPPEPTAFGWKVASENRAEFWFLALQRHRPAHLLDRHHLPIKRFITYAIDGRSHQLRSLYIQQPEHRPLRSWPAATLRVRALARAPRLPSPSPAC